MKYIINTTLIIAVLFAGIYVMAKQGGDIMDISQKVIDASIKTHGGNKSYEKLHLEFDFRDKHYTSSRNKGDFQYTRAFRDKTGEQIKDIMTNETFSRAIDGKISELDQKKINSYRNSINSVNYFALLPYFLNDEAVRKKYLGMTSIKDIPYHKIEVTFSEDGGGEDHDDIYVYWIREKEFTLDYMAYSYQVNQGGVRFREAYNPREIGGIRIQDYVNYKYHNKDFPVDQLDAKFAAGELEELSRIELVNVRAVE